MQIPAIQHCPITERFASIASTPYALLFDTAHKNEGFSIMMWSPSHTIVHQQNRTLVHDEITKKHVFTQAQSLDCVDQLLTEFAGQISVAPHSESLANALPFQAGIAGMATYDLGLEQHFIESKNAPYSIPKLCIGIYTQCVIYEHASNQQFFCYLNDSPLPDAQALDRVPKKFQPQVPYGFKLTSAWTSNLSKQDYKNALSKIRDYLIAGDCYQTNYAQRFSCQFEGDAFYAYLKMREANNAPFSAFMRLKDDAIISVSPERFLSVKRGVVETKPIKGTRPRHHDDAIDKANAHALLEAEKDRAENLMIVDLLRNDLSKHCQPHSIEVPKLFTLESYEAVHHMVSTVVGKLKPQSTPLMLFRDAFPGGSITGAPKVRAMQIIDELEPNGRAIYCGSMLYVGWQQDMDSNICIRTLLANRNTLYCWAGGGIVIDSIINDEYQETLDKVAKILPVLEIE